MLVHLAIKDLAIIEDAAIDFAEGLNALTGETGAGKSIIIGALELVLGDRARADIVRHGATHAEVCAQFRVRTDSPAAQRLAEIEAVTPGDGEDGTLDLVVRRIVPASGRGRVYINGVLVSVGTLRGVTAGLVDISSQHEHTALLDAASHLDILDRFGDHAGPRAAFDTAFRALSAARRERDALREREQTRLQREDYVRFQLAEIEKVAPRAGEDETLDAERARLAHAEGLMNGARQVESLLSGRDTAVGEQLLQAIRALDRLVSVDPSLETYLGRLESARIELDDIAYEMRRYSDAVEIDPRRLEKVEERLDALKRLKRKHALDVEGLLALAAALDEEARGFESLEEAIREADALVERLSTAAMEHAEVLSRARRQAADALEALVAEQLDALAMRGARIRFRLERRDALGPQGVDTGEILIAPNVGESEKSLAKVASGGELSRVLLALKTILGAVDDVHCAVFDEVDTGVGGAVAEVIALALKRISRDRQVVVITHLAQIAAHAGHHLRVDKLSDGKRTTTRVLGLDAPARADEIARMIGGLEITRRTRDHAAELLRRGTEVEAAHA
ncbi:MAG: DNA repair protein RecN [Deltaproteobacteria bacterium]|nr:DNA repair protein RecN [Deltaproteobacteria bacterium]MCB9786787.1 DNA repair protein RecN [Deltaproteobacteria bacterium]